MDFRDLVLDSRIPVYIQIAGFVKQQILLGKAVSEDPMPSRREIAAILDINPNTAQKAFKLMEDEGFVVTSKNLGSNLYIDDEIYLKIKTELTTDLAKDFIRSAKAAGLSFDDIIKLIHKNRGVD